MPKQIPIGPSWAEVVFGAVLSFLLGVALAAGSLVLKPVTIVKELPKEEDRKADMVYHFEGTRDGTRGRLSAAKRTQFAQGASVTVNEDEINLLVPTGNATGSAPTPTPPKAKASEKEKKGKEKEKSQEFIPTADASVQPPNFRIHQGVMQISVPLKINVAGIESTVFIRALGKFSKDGSRVAFVPDSVWAGSLSLDRLPFVNSFVYEKFIGSQPIPEDIAASWAKLVGVHIDGNQLKLTMP